MMERPFIVGRSPFIEDRVAHDIVELSTILAAIVELCWRGK
jgi:hypothetical protein|nr:MAG TPA: hypothetical protein [Bacteriophage sp.]